MGCFLANPALRTLERPSYSLLSKLAFSSAKYQCRDLLAFIFGQQCLLSLFPVLFTCCSGIMNPWNFWNVKVLRTLYQKKKKIVSSSLLHQCLVLLLSTFFQKFPDFDQDNFWHFRVPLKQKGQSRKKIMNDRNLMFLRGVYRHIVSGRSKFFWVHGDALKSQLFKVFWPRQF